MESPQRQVCEEQSDDSLEWGRGVMKKNTCCRPALQAGSQQCQKPASRLSNSLINLNMHLSRASGGTRCTNEGEPAACIIGRAVHGRQQSVTMKAVSHAHRDEGITAVRGEYVCLLKAGIACSFVAFVLFEVLFMIELLFDFIFNVEFSSPPAPPPPLKMAEITGLVLSGVALASLFKTCVEVVEYFEDSKNWILDFGLALTKVDLLKMRLIRLESIISSWSAVQDIEDMHCARLSHHLPSLAVTQGMKGVDEIVQRASKLCRRYSCKPQRWRPVTKQHRQSPDLNQRTGERATDSSAVSVRDRPGQWPAGWLVLGRRITWAAYDKKKFALLISDFEFFLSNLESVIHFSAGQLCPVESPPPQEAHSLPTLQSESMSQGRSRDPSRDIRGPSNSANMSRRREECSRLPAANPRQQGPSSYPESSPARTRHQPEARPSTQNSRITVVPGSRFTNSTTEGHGVAQFGDSIAPFSGEVPAHYDNNTTRDNAFAHHGRTDSVIVQAMINAWKEKEIAYANSGRG